MQGFIGNTDYDWFSFLRDLRPPPDEVNFWQPSGGGAFRAVAPGEPFFFRLKKPHYAIAGFGLFARHEIIPASLAWESFGRLNGAETFDEMCRRIEKYRARSGAELGGQYRVGCLMISQPVFFADGDWVAEPSDFQKNIVRGKGLDLSEGEGLRIWEECLERAQAPNAIRAAQPTASYDAPGERFGEPFLVRPRLGQGTFRVAVTQAYHGACAVSGEHSLPVLDVAHIQGYAEGGAHDVQNGLLLRTDIHRLFDRGYVTVTPEGRFEVSRRLKDEWENGKTYYAFDGRSITLPTRSEDRPDPTALRWHNENVFERRSSVG